MEQLQQVLADLGLAWETTSHLGCRIHRLKSVGLAAAAEGQYRLVGELTPRPDPRAAANDEAWLSAGDPRLW